MLHHKSSIFAALILWAGLAGIAPAQILSASEFVGGILEECGGVRDLHLDEAGSIFVVCNAQQTASDGDQTSHYILKFNRAGVRDISWGDAGAARITYSNLDCPPAGCALAYSAAARVGGFWLVMSSGRVFKLLSNGKWDQSYTGRAIPNITPTPSFGYPYLIGIAQQPDGGLVSLSVPAPNASTLVLRRLGLDGRLIKEIPYARLMPTLGIMAWSFDPENFDLTITTVSNQPAVELGRTVITSDGRTNVMSGSVVDVSGNPTFRQPSLIVLGDGRLLGGGYSQVYKWRADGMADAEYGVPGQLGFRVNPYALDCFSSSTAPGITLRSHGAVTVHFAKGFILLGVHCTGFWESVISGDGRDDTFASPIASSSWSRVDRDGGIVMLQQVGSGKYRLQRSEGPGPEGTRARADVRVVEYYNSTLDHYFLTAHEHEVAFVDQGNAGAGWKRTGHVFGAWNIETPIEGTHTVCRYYGDPKGGPNSHFYSAEKFECDALQASDNATPLGKPAWRFERDAFRIAVPLDGKCAPNLTPIYRLYNNGAAKRIDSNHRYVSSLEVYVEMQAKGWVGEGVHMCSSGN